MLSYADGDGYHFMDQETFETLTLRPETVGDDSELLADNVIVQVQKFNGNPIGIQLPPHVQLTVTYTEPGVRGDTASGGVTKAATLNTGLQIRAAVHQRRRAGQGAHGNAGIRGACLGLV